MFKITTVHGEGKTVFHLVDTSAPESEQPAIVLSVVAGEACNYPCTVGVGSDRYAADVVKIITPRWMRVVQRSNREAYNKNPNDHRNYLDWTLRKDGRWRVMGSGKRSGFGISFGAARDYRDPSY